MNLPKIDNKYIYIILGIGALYWFIFVRKSKDELDKEKNSNDYIDSVNTKLDNLVKVTNEQPNNSSDDYKKLANTLYEAMKGLGTDNDAITEVFNNYIFNLVDVLNLIKSFGVRESETLIEWLRDDLSSGEIYDLNAMLSQRGINFQI